jgi:hypothetical protein
MKTGVGSGLLLAGLSLLACGQQSEPEMLPVSQLSAAADCNVLAGCRVGDVDTHVEVRFGTRPRALQPFPVAVKSVGMGQATAVTVSFSMHDMSMGLNRYALNPSPEGEWQGEVTLPICVSGRTDWVAEFEIRFPDRRMRLALPFVLEK